MLIRWRRHQREALEAIGQDVMEGASPRRALQEWVNATLKG